MATPQEYVEYVVNRVEGYGNIRYRKMFGEYMIYVDERPLLLVCDSTVYVKKLEELVPLMQDASQGFPYERAKEHYILDIDRDDLGIVIEQLRKLVPLKKKKS